MSKKTKVTTSNIQPNPKEAEIWAKINEDGSREVKQYNSSTGKFECCGGSGSEENDSDSLCVEILDPSFKLSAVVDVFTQTVTYYKTSWIELKDGRYKCLEYTAITENEYRDLANEYNVSSFNSIENNIIKVNGYARIKLIAIYSTTQYFEEYVDESRVNSGESASLFIHNKYKQGIFGLSDRLENNNNLKIVVGDSVTINFVKL